MVLNLSTTSTSCTFSLSWVQGFQHALPEMCVLFVAFLVPPSVGLIPEVWGTWNCWDLSVFLNSPPSQIQAQAHSNVVVVNVPVNKRRRVSQRTHFHISAYVTSAGKLLARTHGSLWEGLAKDRNIGRGWVCGLAAWVTLFVLQQKW